MQSNDFRIGIIGGAGPMASSYMYQDIIREYQATYGAYRDADFPYITLLNVPFESDVINTETAEEKHTQLVNQLQDAVETLSRCHVSRFGIACNTLHAYMPEVTCHEMEFVHLIHSVINMLCHSGATKAVCLATPTTSRKLLYNIDSQVTIAYPHKAHQEEITKIIYRILRGIHTLSDAQQLRTIAQRECDREATNHVILGCTDLTVLYRSYPDVFQMSNLAIYDTIAILARSLIDTAD